MLLIFQGFLLYVLEGNIIQGLSWLTMMEGEGGGGASVGMIYPHTVKPMSMC